MCSHANLLVWVEGDAHFAMLDFGMLLQVHHGRDDFGDTCFVVSTEQGGAIGHDEVFAHVVEELGEVARLHYGVGIQGDVLAVVVIDDARVDVLALSIWSGVHVGNKAEDGDILHARGGR